MDEKASDLSDSNNFLIEYLQKENLCSLLFSLERTLSENTIKNIDDTYKAELNFVDEFNLSRHGMILEIKQELIKRYIAKGNTNLTNA